MAWYVADRLTRPQLTVYLLDVWTGAEWPRETATWHLAHAGRFPIEPEIAQMFRLAGILKDDPATAPPTDPMRLYRGCTEYGAEGFSWTTNPETARWFAKREALFSRDPDEHGDPIIVAAVIDPDHILAIVTQGRNEAEVIIDPIGAAPNIEAGVYLWNLDIPDIRAQARHEGGGVVTGITPAIQERVDDHHHETMERLARTARLFTTAPDSIGGR